jgi:hypothetical protein
MKPRCNGRSLATSMGKLDGNLLVLRVGEVDNLLERADLLVAPEAGVLRGNTAIRQYSSRLSEGEARSTS